MYVFSVTHSFHVAIPVSQILTTITNSTRITWYVMRSRPITWVLKGEIQISRPHQDSRPEGEDGRYELTNTSAAEIEGGRTHDHLTAGLGDDNLI